VMDANTVFAEWLRTARTEAGLSQQKVAERMREAGYTTFRQTKVLLALTTPIRSGRDQVSVRSRRVRVANGGRW